MNATDTEESVSADLREEMEAKEPNAEQKAELRAQHRHHLVRDTESKLTIEVDVGEELGAEATVTVPDTYCFTCDEWVGFSGVDLRGTPRSRDDAYYLGGPPEGVGVARDSVTDATAELVQTVVRNVPHAETVDDALDFIETELEQARARVEVSNQLREVSDNGGQNE
jgi:hypothetical protein